MPITNVYVTNNIILISIIISLSLLIALHILSPLSLSLSRSNSHINFIAPLIITTVIETIVINSTIIIISVSNTIIIGHLITVIEIKAQETRPVICPRLTSCPHTLVSMPSQAFFLKASLTSFSLIRTEAQESSPK